MHGLYNEEADFVYEVDPEKWFSRNRSPSDSDAQEILGILVNAIVDQILAGISKSPPNPTSFPYSLYFSVRALNFLKHNIAWSEL